MEFRKIGREDAAKFLGVSSRTLANYVTAGKLTPAYVKGPTRDVQEFDQGELETLKAEKESGIPLSRNTKPETGIEKVEASIIPFSTSRTPESGNYESGNFTIISDSSFGVLLDKISSVPLDRKPILTFAEAAQFTGISEKLLRDAAKVGDLKVRKIGRAQRILQDDLIVWIRAQFA